MGTLWALRVIGLRIYKDVPADATRGRKMTVEIIAFDVGLGYWMDFSSTQQRQSCHSQTTLIL